MPMINWKHPDRRVHAEVLWIMVNLIKTTVGVTLAVALGLMSVRFIGPEIFLCDQYGVRNRTVTKCFGGKVIFRGEGIRSILRIGFR